MSFPPLANLAGSVRAWKCASGNWGGVGSVSSESVGRLGKDGESVTGRVVMIGVLQQRRIRGTPKSGPSSDATCLLPQARTGKGRGMYCFWFRKGVSY